MLKAEKISKVYTLKDRHITVLSDVSFVLEPQEFVFLVGKSGAGKTTLLKIIFLEEPPTSGHLYFNNIEITHLPEKLVQVYRQHVGVVFQDYKLLENRTARENIEFVLELFNKSKKEIKKITDYLLELVELKDRADLFPAQLSGGEKRRIAIARAVAHRPKVLLADEPTGDLDEENSMLIMQILERVNQSGTSIIMATHRLDLITSYKYPLWKLQEGVLLTDVDRKNIKDLYSVPEPSLGDKYLILLVKHLSVGTYKKLFRIKPSSIREILELTPKQLKQQLDFTDTEINELKKAIRGLQNN